MGLCIIEWGELIEDVLPPNYIKIDFEKDFLDDNKRILNITAYGKRFQNILEELVNNI